MTTEELNSCSNCWNRKDYGGDELEWEKNQEPWLDISGIWSVLSIYVEILGTKVRYTNVPELLMTTWVNFRVTAYRRHLKPLGMNTCVQAEKRAMLRYCNVYEEQPKKEKVDRGWGRTQEIVILWETTEENIWGIGMRNNN